MNILYSILEGVKYYRKIEQGGCHKSDPTEKSLEGGE